MRASTVIALASAAALAAGAAFAQTAAPAAGADTAVNPPAATAPAASTQVDLNPAGGFASSDTLGDASKLKAGDPNVVSNGPVPDTHANRAKYGRPMSQAGRRTAATGD